MLNLSFEWEAWRVKSPARMTTGIWGEWGSVNLLRGEWKPEMAKRERVSLADMRKMDREEMVTRDRSVLIVPRHTHANAVWLMESAAVMAHVVLIGSGSPWILR
jgi:hypothetical protein